LVQPRGFRFFVDAYGIVVGTTASPLQQGDASTLQRGGGRDHFRFRVTRRNLGGSAHDWEITTGVQ